MEIELSVMFYQGIVSIFREDTFIELRKSFEILCSRIKRERVRSFSWLKSQSYLISI